MRILLIIFLLAITSVLCFNCEIIEIPKECYTIGNERCHENKAQWCNYDYYYETFQDCTAIGEICYYNDPSHAGGYTDIAVCD